MRQDDVGEVVVQMLVVQVPEAGADIGVLDRIQGVGGRGEAIERREAAEKPAMCHSMFKIEAAIVAG